MFETVLERRQRLQRAVREFLDLSACRVFTVRQQILWALACAAIGAAAAAVYLGTRPSSAPSAPPALTALDPQIERAGNPVIEGDYSVYRLRWAFGGAEISPCHIVAWHGTGKWTLKC